MLRLSKTRMEMMKIELTQDDYHFLQKTLEDLRGLIAENNKLKNQLESERKLQIDFDTRVISAFADTFRAIERRVPELQVDFDSIKMSLME